MPSCPCYRRAPSDLKGGFGGVDVRPVRTGSVVEVEVAGRLLLEPQAVVVRGVLEEVGRLLEHVLAVRAAARRRRLELVGIVVGGRLGKGRLRGQRVVVERGQGTRGGGRVRCLDRLRGRRQRVVAGGLGVDRLVDLGQVVRPRSARRARGRRGSRWARPGPAPRTPARAPAPRSPRRRRAAAAGRRGRPRAAREPRPGLRAGSARTARPRPSARSPPAAEAAVRPPRCRPRTPPRAAAARRPGPGSPSPPRRLRRIRGRSPADDARGRVPQPPAVKARRRWRRGGASAQGARVLRRREFPRPEG